MGFRKVSVDDLIIFKFCDLISNFHDLVINFKFYTVITFMYIL